MSRELVEKLGFAEKADNILWTYGDREFSLRRSPDELYREWPALLPAPPRGSFREECFRAARLISERVRRPVILYSGGVDSEAVVLSFHLQKLPFEIVVIDFDEVNREDVAQARRFCERLGLPYRLLSFDLYRFWENDLEAWARRVHCASPQVAALSAAISRVDGYVISGDGDSHLERGGWEFFETKRERWALARSMLLQGQEGCPRFFQYTAELEASIYFEPLVEQFTREPVWDFLDFRKFMYLKLFLFFHHFGCELRPKRTGFEEARGERDYRIALERLLGPERPLSWAFSSARSWASGRTPSRLIPFEEMSLHPFEKENLSRRGMGHHLFWTE